MKIIFRWYGNVGRFLNHSCDPNVKYNDLVLDSERKIFGNEDYSISFTAIKQINKGDEITWSYSDNKSNFLSQFGFECKCKKCNKDETKTDGRKRKSLKRKSKKRKTETNKETIEENLITHKERNNNIKLEAWQVAAVA